MKGTLHDPRPPRVPGAGGLHSLSSISRPRVRGGPLAGPFFLATAFLLAPFALQAQEKPAQAERWLDELLEEAEAQFQSHHEDLGRLDTCLDKLTAALHLAPEDPEVLWRIARVHFMKGEALEKSDGATKREKVAHYEEALEWAEKALEHERDHIEAVYWAAVSQARLADLKGIFSALSLVGDAKKGLERAIELCLKRDPDHPVLAEAYIVRGVVYRESPWIAGGSKKKAEEYIKKGIEQDPHLTLGWLNLARTYVKQDRWQEAKEACLRVIDEESPTYPWEWALYDRPAAEELLQEIRKELGSN